MRRRTLEALGIGATTIFLFVALEGGTRLALRLQIGAWPQTRDVWFAAAQRSTAALYRRHPFLVAAAREGAKSQGNRIQINSLGYRSPERPAAKPAGMLRVVCAGGSTTWDVIARSNARTWPAFMESEIQKRGLRSRCGTPAFPAGPRLRA